MEPILDKETIFLKIKEHLTGEFKIDTGLISPEKSLEEDLQLDSLDMVDFLISLKDLLREDYDPSILRGANTVQEVVDLLTPIWKQA